MPKISIIVPIYNASKYLRECLNSIISQSLDDIEIICVNDGSIDNSLDVLKEYEKNDNRIFVFNRKHEGAGCARNFGLSKASSPYVLFFDSDDFMYKNSISRLYNNAIENKSDIAIGLSKLFLQNKKMYKDISSIDFKYVNSLSFSPFEISNSIFQFCVGWPWDKLYRREFILQNNLQFQNLRHSNDTFFVLNSLVLANKISIVKEVLFVHRKHDSSLSNTRDDNPCCPYFALEKLYKELQNRNIYNNFNISFVNYAVTFFLWHYKTLKFDGSKKALSILFSKLFNEIKLKTYPKFLFNSKNEFELIKKMYSEGVLNA